MFYSSHEGTFLVISVDEVYGTQLVAFSPINLISNDLVNDDQCDSGGYEDTISPAFAGANSGAFDSQSGKFIFFCKFICVNRFDI